MTRTAPFLLGLLLWRKAAAADTNDNNKEGSLRGAASATEEESIDPQIFDHPELFKIPFDKNFFRTPRARRKLQQQQAQEDDDEESDGTTSMMETEGPIDLNFRFNKFNFMTDEIPAFMPLTGMDYPIRDEIAVVLKNQSDAVSVVCDGDAAFREGDEARIQRYLEEIGGPPTMPRHPNTGHLELDDDEFWDEFRRVAQLQYGRRQDMHPGTILRKPNLWLETRGDIHLVAEAVHDEYPGSLQVELIEWLWKHKAPADHDILPFRSNSDFIGLQVAMADLNTWAIGAVAPMNFYVKWYVGRPRPEEVAYAIAKREINYEDGVPPDIVQLIDIMGLTSAEDFTAYPEGSPRHPAWPAMHSAASSASFWLAVILDLTEEQYCEALRVDYAVAFARTCAGVHYATDNIAGLNLGQAIIADLLPDHLAEHYGSDPEKVRAKIDRLRFDWNDFDSYTCSGPPQLH